MRSGQDHNESLAFLKGLKLSKHLYVKLRSGDVVYYELIGSFFFLSLFLYCPGGNAVVQSA